MMRNEELRISHVAASASEGDVVGVRHPKLRRVVGVMLTTGLISGLAGCALNDTQHSAEATLYGKPQISAMPLLVRGDRTSEGRYALGKYYYFQDRLDKAGAAFEDALRLDPSNIDAMNGLASVYDRLGKFDVAEKIYRAALKIQPDAAYVWANLGYSLILRGDKTAAVYPLQQAVRIDPANTVARNYLASLGVEAKVAQVGAAYGVAKPAPAQAAPAETAAPSSAPANAPASGMAAEMKPAVAAVQPPVLQADESVRRGNVTVAENAAQATGSITPLMNSKGVDPSRVTMVAPRSIPAKADTAEDEAVGVRVPAMAAGNSPQSTRQAIASDSDRNPAITGARATIPSTGARTDSAQASGGAYAALPAALSGLRIEVSNGNGVEGMARAIGKEIRHAGVNVARITNAKPFDKPRTFIVCKYQLRTEAARLAAVLPGKPKIMFGSTVYRRVDMRVVLGADSALAWNQPSAKRVFVASAK